VLERTQEIIPELRRVVIKIKEVFPEVMNKLFITHLLDVKVLRIRNPRDRLVLVVIIIGRLLSAFDDVFHEGMFRRTVIKNNIEHDLDSDAMSFIHEIPEISFSSQNGSHFTIVHHIITVPILLIRSRDRLKPDDVHTKLFDFCEAIFDRAETGNRMAITQIERGDTVDNGISLEVRKTLRRSNHGNKKTYYDE